AAETDRHLVLEQNAEFLEHAAGQLFEGARSGPRKWNAVAIGRDQLVADADPAILSPDVKLRQKQVAGQDQFQLALLDDPPLEHQFGATSDALGQNFGPVELDAAESRVVLGTDQAAVAGREAHQE